MSDSRFTLEEAVKMLSRDASRRLEGLAAEAERLEEHLRLAYEGREPNLIQNVADVVHTFELNVRSEISTGASLEVMAYGNQLGRTLVAPPIKEGRYRAVLLLTTLEPEKPR